jgi:hypothetical protein
MEQALLTAQHHDLELDVAGAFVGRRDAERAQRLERRRHARFGHRAALGTGE